MVYKMGQLVHFGLSNQKWIEIDRFSLDIRFKKYNLHHLWLVLMG